MKPELPLPWKTGVTLITQQTKNWSTEQIDQNNEREARLVFSSFTAEDLGRSRQCVAQVTGKQDAAYIAHAANAYPRLIELARTWARRGNDPQILCREADKLLRELGESE